MSNTLMPLHAFRAALLCFLAVLAVGCKEEGGVKVTSFTFHGNEAVSAGQLKQVLATQASSKLPWGQRHYFSREQFEADLKRIVAFYTDRGFPSARVTSFDVTLNEEQTSVSITLNIAEGEPIRVERLEYQGFDTLPERRRQRLEGRMPLQAGQPLDRALLAASRETALDLLRDSGYPYASVRLDEGEGGTENSRVIVLQADPGPVARIGAIEVSGNSSVSDDVVRRHLTFKPGDLYRQSRLHDSQRNLYGLELFQFANVEPMQIEKRATTVPVRVTVTEGKHRRVTLGVGYGSEERARAEVDWRHVNFFGGARTASVFARYSGLDGGLRLNLTQPYVFSPNYTLGVSGQAWHTAEPAYTLNTTGGRVTVTRQVGRGNRSILGGRPSMSFSLTYANEWESSELSRELLEDLSLRDDLIAMGIDPTRGESSGQRSALILDASRNTTNNVLDARRGYVAAVHLEQAGKFLGGSYDYYEVTGEGRFYQSLGRVVLAAQGRAGSIDAWGDPEVQVPFFKRYFLGGASNLRGWGRFDVAPLSGFGLPIGGHTFANFSAEVRVPIWGDLGGVIFLDGGNVWENEWDFNVGDMRYDVGPGLRYNTPIGPIRADLGYQLNRIDGLLVNGKPESRRFRFHFSIGQAF
jgi:outer membrane protein assembly complex protein YaeT